MDLEEHQLRIERLRSKSRKTTEQENINALIDGIINDELSIKDVLSFTTIPEKELVRMIEERQAK